MSGAEDRIDRLVKAVGQLEGAVTAQGDALQDHRIETRRDMEGLRSDLREDFKQVHKRISEHDSKHRDLSAAHRSEAQALIEGHVAQDHRRFDHLDGRVSELERRHIGEDAVTARAERHKRVRRAVGHTALGAALAAIGTWLVQHFGGK